MPDPTVVEVDAGGTFDAQILDTFCFGRITYDTPDITIDFSRPEAPLHIYVLSEADTTLVVRLPNGSWLCDDDSDGLNPSVRIEQPSGRYAIWVGVIDDEQYPPATVLISEREPDWGLRPPGVSPRGIARGPREREPLAFAARTGSPAETIIRQITGALDAFAATLPNDLSLDLAAPATAAEDGTTVRARLPGLQLRDDLGNRFLFGDVTVDVTPRDGGRYEFVVGIPLQMNYFEGDARLASVWFGRARVTGTWSTAVRTFTAIDLYFADVAVTDFATRTPVVRARIGAFAINRVLSPGAGGLWGGTYETALRNLHVDTANNGAFAVGGVRVLGALEGYDIARLASLTKRSV